MKTNYAFQNPDVEILKYRDIRPLGEPIGQLKLIDLSQPNTQIQIPSTNERRQQPQTEFVLQRPVADTFWDRNKNVIIGSALGGLTASALLGYAGYRLHNVYRSDPNLSAIEIVDKALSPFQRGEEAFDLDQYDSDIIVADQIIQNTLEPEQLFFEEEQEPQEIMQPEIIMKESIEKQAQTPTIQTEKKKRLIRKTRWDEISELIKDKPWLTDEQEIIDKYYTSAGFTQSTKQLPIDEKITVKLYKKRDMLYAPAGRLRKNPWIYYEDLGDLSGPDKRQLNTAFGKLQEAIDNQNPIKNINKAEIKKLSEVYKNVLRHNFTGIGTDPITYYDGILAKSIQRFNDAKKEERKYYRRVLHNDMRASLIPRVFAGLLSYANLMSPKRSLTKLFGIKHDSQFQTKSDKFQYYFPTEMLETFMPNLILKSK